MIKQHLESLGHKAKDKVTGFKGIIDSISFDLYGCVQATISPEVDKNGEIKDAKWFDITRLEITSKEPVMALPDFSKGYIAKGLKGAANKPLR